jgi:hypothetical protein
MRRITVVLVCAMIAPLAFAQTKSTKTEQTTATQPATTETVTTYTAGVVTKYQPGKTIVVNSNTQGPVSFALGASARIVNTAGNARPVTRSHRRSRRVNVSAFITRALARIA